MLETSRAPTASLAAAEIQLAVAGMTCAVRIEKKLNRLDGVPAGSFRSDANGVQLADLVQFFIV